MLTSKFTELKRQGLFLRSSPDFYKTDWVGNSSSTALNVSSSGVFVVFLRNPDSGAGFYFVRQNDTTSTYVPSSWSDIPVLMDFPNSSALTSFALQVSTTDGTKTLPQTLPSITLSGRQSKVIVTDYKFGASSNILYSTASILFAGQVGHRDVLFLYGDSDQQHEFTIDLRGSATTTMDEHVKVAINSQSATTIFTVRGNVTRLITVFDSDEQLVLFSDTNTAGTFFAPVIPTGHTSEDSQTFRNYWQIGSNNTVLVGGPYLVRNASISGSELRLWGDLNTTISTILTVISPTDVSSVSWNGRKVYIEKASSALPTRYGGFVAQFDPRIPPNSFSVPGLSGWRFANSLPEIHSNFSDNIWVVANHTYTNTPYKPFYGDGRVLYGCDYGL